MSVAACPVCRAALRGTAACGRCKADLTWPMAAQARAWRLRSEGWAALLANDLTTARARAQAALALEDCASARRLSWLTSVLV